MSVADVLAYPVEAYVVYLLLALAAAHKPFCKDAYLLILLIGNDYAAHSVGAGDAGCHKQVGRVLRGGASQLLGTVVGGE